MDKQTNIELPHIRKLWRYFGAYINKINIFNKNLKNIYVKTKRK